MSDQSTIEWTDATWNPVRGCTKVSPGCKHCYAETFAERFRGVPGHPYEQGFDPRIVPEKLMEPLGWKKPRDVFVNSMSDLFMDEVPDEYLDRVFAVMLICAFHERRGGHTFQVLTKRAERMAAYLADRGRCIEEWARAAGRMMEDGDAWHDTIYTRCSLELELPESIWLGVSVEDRKFGLPRIEHLRKTPAAVRFLSIEPLLEDLGQLDLAGIDWVIVGGESGHGAREMDPAWVRSVRDQCVAAGVPFFFKQWGGVRKKVKGRILDGRTWDEMPARATRAAA